MCAACSNHQTLDPSRDTDPKDGREAPGGAGVGSKPQAPAVEQDLRGVGGGHPCRHEVCCAPVRELLLLRLCFWIVFVVLEASFPRLAVEGALPSCFLEAFARISEHFCFCFAFFECVPKPTGSVASFFPLSKEHRDGP